MSTGEKVKIGNRFEDLLHQLRLTANAAAPKIGITAPTIGAILKGKTYPSSKILIPLGKIFNVNLNWLLIGTGEMFCGGLEQNKIIGDEATILIGANHGTIKNTSGDSSETKYLKKEISSLQKQIEELKADKEFLKQILKK